MTWRLAAAPRKWQLEALSAWQRNHRGVASVVTGAGKTMFAHQCILDLSRMAQDFHVVILVPTTALLDQWYVSLREDLNVAEYEIALFGGGNRSSEPKLVNVVVLNTGRDVAPQLSRCRQTFLIVDECHRAGSQVNSRALQGEHLAALGLSATPVREYDEGFQEYVVPAIGDVIYEYGYEDAARDGVITSFDLVNVRVPLLRTEERDYERITRRIQRLARRAPQSEDAQVALERLLRQRAAISASAAARIPMTVRLVEQHPGARCIVFHERVSAARKLAGILQERGASVTEYHTGIGPSRRRENLRLYRRGIFDCLVTCRALDEGANVPETSVAVVASSSASNRQRIQRLGRVLRSVPGKEHAVVYTVYATALEEQRLVHEAARMGGIARITWISGGFRGYGEDPDG